MGPAPADDLQIIHQAYRIAERDLRACYNPHGIVAGRLHFNAYWSRDGFWALFGALALGDYDEARAHLDTFIKYQLPTGEVPVRVEYVGHTLGGYHTQRMMPRAIYRAGAIFPHPIDPSALFIIAAREYFARTHDMDFTSRFEPAMDRAARWLLRFDRDGDGMIENHYLADWMDSILKKNKVFYLNLLLYEGLRTCELLKRELGRRQDEAFFHDAAERLGGQLQMHFWNGTYFTDWIRGDRRGGFCADGNALSVFFGTASAEQAASILRFIQERSLDAATPLRTCDPVYSGWQVFPFYYLAGIPDYHRTLIWPWLGTLNAVNKWRLGRSDEAVADLARIAGWYVRQNVVAEVYEQDGTPVNRRFFQAEFPFAWNAGLFVYAAHACGFVEKRGAQAP